MAILRNKRKLVVVSRETQEEHPRNSQLRETSVRRINEDYITQVSEEIEGRVTRKLSYQFSRTEFWILGALSKLVEFLLSRQIRILSRVVPETSRNIDVENQEPTGDRSENDAHTEVEFSVCQSRYSIGSDPEQASHSNSIKN